MDELKFSVIIPVYNSQDYIQECVDSVLRQDYKDYEIIIVNDGSTDGSLDKINTLYEQHEKISIYSTKNAGVSSARNFGLSKAKGEWVTFLDSDDWIEKDTLNYVADLLKMNQDIDVILTNLFINQDDRQTIPYNLTEDQMVNKFDDMLETIISIDYGERKFGKKYGNCRCAGAKFYRKDLLFENGIQFPLGIKVFEDGIFNLYANYYSKKTYIAKKATYHYRQNNNSVVHSYRNDQEFQNQRILSEIRNFIELAGDYLLESYYYCIFDLLLVLIHNLTGITAFHDRKSVFKKIKDVINSYEEGKFLTRIDKKYLSSRNRIILFLLKNNCVYFVYYAYYLKKREKTRKG